MNAPKILSLSWVSYNGKIIVISKSLNTFAHAFIAILLGIYLADIGFTIIQVGAFFSAGVAGGAVFAFCVGIFGDRIGRRRLLIIFTGITAICGSILAVIDHFPLLMIVAFIGNFDGKDGQGSSQALLPIEQASLSDASSPNRRTDLFALYRISATICAAFGALAAGIPEIYRQIFGLSALFSIQIMFFTFSAILVTSTIFYSRLSIELEVSKPSAKWVNPFKLPSRNIIFTLVGLFSLDAFGGSLIIQSLVAYWFKSNFGLDVGSLALVFFFSHIFSATSLWISAKLTNRFGAINTMVFTHIPANLFLLAAAFAPNATIAVILWQLRSFLSQMDVPPRDSYTMGILESEERVSMASMHVVGRNVTGTIGPSTSTILWQFMGAGAPFIFGSITKITYDIILYAMFRNIKPK